MRRKTLMIGLPLAVVCLWWMVTWEPVARESAPPSHEQPAEAAIAPAPTPAPMPAAAKPRAAPPKAQPSTSLVSTTSEDEPEAEPAAPAQEHSSFTLVHIEDKPIDLAHLPPPRSSGPLQKLQGEFEGASRDSNSAPLEGIIEAAFQGSEVPKELLESATCHGAVCRVRTRWTPERAGGFFVAITSLATNAKRDDSKAALFERNYAVGEASERNTNGERYLEVYLRKAHRDDK